VQSRAAVLDSSRGNVKIEKLDLAELPAHCLLVRTAVSGICGTDLHALQGTIEADFPVVLGHEAAGSVVEVGRDVKHISKTDRVVISAITPCFSCENCLSSRPYLCKRSEDIIVATPLRRNTGQPVYAFFGIGSLSELLIVPASAAILIPDDIPWSIAALMACGGQTGLGSVFNTAPVMQGNSVVVFGCGTVGLCVIMASKIAGATTIIAVDTNEERLTLAHTLGASMSLNPLKTQAVSEVLNATASGCDFAFECVGKVDVMEKALKSTKPGGKLIIIGATPKGVHFSIDARFLLEGRSVEGSLAGSVQPRRDYSKWFHLYREGKLPLDKLLTRNYELEMVNLAFEQMVAGEVTKPIVVF
jgi:S-(hydroxymethyl)glutathione dehydrogenase/alcohol dehydrogenase